MNWEAIAAIAEIVASIAVVISLGYLSIQIRRQTVESKLAAGNEFVNQLNFVFENLSDNAELASLFHLGINDFHSLGPGQKIQISTYFNRMLRIVEGMFGLPPSRQTFLRLELAPGGMYEQSKIFTRI